MPDLSSQIRTLYRVINQSRPECGSDDLRMQADYLAPRRTATPGSWICSFYCLWFSLPLSIWLSSGWIGLFLYWQALAGTACLVEKLTGKPKLALAGLASGKGEM